MLEGLSPGVLTKLGPWGLLILVVTMVVLALLSGRLIPKSSHERELKILEGRAEKAEDREKTWQAAAMTWQQTAQEAISNRDEQLEQGRTLIQMLASIPRGGTGRRGGS